MPRAVRLLSRLLLILLVLALLAFAAGWWALHGSLATLDGELRLSGLDAPVTIERDALGVVTIHAASERDAARALGYVHGQERFFEMDLLRRSAAGELSELFGAAALDRDKSVRRHRLRARVQENMASFAGDKMDVLTAYRDGVNAGLQALNVRPWPYLLLRAKPKPWQLSDSAMAGYAMYFDLQDESNSRELALWKIRQHVPAALYALIAADGTEWDAPLEGQPRGNIALPGPELLDLRSLPAPAKGMEYRESEPAAPGSNNFAVAGALTADNRAIVASDMHLTLRAPNLWFRARLLYDDNAAAGGKVDVAGFTLPGLPAVIAGSNRHVAWGFTNSYGDWLDWAVIDGRAQPQPWVLHREEIKIKGAPSVFLDVKDTAWGPIFEEGKDGRMLALRWTAHRPGSLSVGVMKFAESGDLAQALANADSAGIPAQNLMLADATGRIAWTLIGQPAHLNTACDWTAPVTLDPAVAAGDQALCPNDGSDIGWKRPVITDPPQGRLWTANNRVTDGDDLKRIGDSGYANGARARQIRDDLFAKNRFAERDLLSVQIDDRSLFLQRWWQQLRTLSERSDNPALKRIAAATTHWDARASADAVSYRIVRAWRLAVIERIKNGLTAPAQVALGKDFVMPDLPQIEGVAWQLVTAKPAHLLPRQFDSWDALLTDAAEAAAADLERNGPLAQRTWGERNTAHICHPLVRALPRFQRWLCMPAEPLDGDANMPRVVAPDFGGSERMVVSPGHEEDGIIHMPGGQSGNLLSPFWGAGHEAWVHGAATPFLPGKTMHTLTVKP